MFMNVYTHEKYTHKKVPPDGSLSLHFSRFYIFYAEDYCKDSNDNEDAESYNELFLILTSINQLIRSSKQHLEIGPIITPILQKRKMRYATEATCPKSQRP